MNNIRFLISRASLVGWGSIALAAMGFIANLEDIFSFRERVLSTPLLNIPIWFPWALGVAGVVYLIWLWYIENRIEPIRQLLRSCGYQAATELDIVGSGLEAVLGNTRPIGRLAQLALEDKRNVIDRLKCNLTENIDSGGRMVMLRPHKAEACLVTFLNEYEHYVYRMRDGGLAAKFDFSSNGNFLEWKRYDTELLKGVRQLISQSRYAQIRKGLQNSIWRDGIRRYL